jgi:cytochrome c oxidase assembly protein subunit 15
MLLHLRSDRAPAAALHEPAIAAGQWFSGWRLAALDRPGWLRAVLAAASLFGLVAFISGGGNRLTRGPWFLYPPQVSLVPPFGRAAWQHAFELHQQSPLYALCGGYDVGGMESITIYRFLYWWEWSRIASVVLLAASLFVAGLLLLSRSKSTAHRSSPKPWLAVLAAGVGYFVLRYFADHAGLFATINLGQHRHALDVTFASVGLAMLIVAAIAPERALSGPAMPRMAWGAAIALTVAFGAMLEALDAGPLWTSFPGYDGHLLPSADRLFAFHPVWRNFTENGYLIQACHRLLSIGLWAAALLAVANAMARGSSAILPLLLVGALTLEGVLGAITLAAARPLLLSIVHQVCAVAVLVVALLPSGARRLKPFAAPKKLAPH